MTDRTRVNPFRIPVIMHLESDVDDCDPVYLGDTDQTGGLTNTCYKEVRHGLYNTMLYMTRPKVVRDTFNRYMYQLACDLTSKSGFPVYWSLTVRGSQNQLGQVYRKAADGTADDTAWQQMKSYLPYCPKGDGDRGYTGAEVRNPNLFQRHCGGFELFRELVTNGCGGT